MKIIKNTVTNKRLKDSNNIIKKANKYNCNVKETRYLNSIPGYAESIEKALKEDRKQCSIYKKGEK